MGTVVLVPSATVVVVPSATVVLVPSATVVLVAVAVALAVVGIQDSGMTGFLASSDAVLTGPAWGGTRIPPQVGLRLLFGRP